MPRAIARRMAATAARRSLLSSCQVPCPMTGTARSSGPNGSARMDPLLPQLGERGSGAAGQGPRSLRCQWRRSFGLVTLRPMSEEQAVDERIEITASMVESLGFRALATAHAFASAMPLAPTLAVKKALVEYVWEELQRFETASDLYVQI